MTTDDTHSRDRQGLSEAERFREALRGVTWHGESASHVLARVLADAYTAGLAARGGNTDNTLRAAVEALHASGGRNHWNGERFVEWCIECRKAWPCPTLAALDAAPAPTDTEQAEAWDQGWQAGLRASASYVWPANPYRTAQETGNGHESDERGVMGLGATDDARGPQNGGEA